MNNLPIQSKRIFSVILANLFVSILFLFLIVVPCYSDHISEENCEKAGDEIDEKVCNLWDFYSILGGDDDEGILKDDRLKSIAAKLVFHKEEKARIEAEMEAKLDNDKKRELDIKKKAEEKKIRMTLERAKQEFLGNMTILPRGFEKPTLAKLLNLDPLATADRLDFDRSKDSEGMKLWFMKNGDAIEPSIHDLLRKECESSALNENCKNTDDDVRNLIRLVSLYHSANRDADQKYLGVVHEHIKELDEEWMKYAEGGRSQTWWEVGINSWIFYQKEGVYDYFQPPPAWQIVFLHPSAIYDYMSSGSDGDQGKLALSMEILGFDVWERGRWDKWYIPTGISGSINYADRAGVDDWGVGVLVHFSHVYSIGYSNYGGESAMSISIDLMKLIDAKKGKYEELKSEWDAFKEKRP